ncbi:MULTISPECIES: hypothetical protein [Legionella]|uniref:DUF4189 domain-containing protein n=1 Tax=Legionella drozanskii LLAP-1 TaxID=1212489 RepID=A0A0W0SS47_9GAMM|nr:MULTISPECIES: hypothetical protein [Legionella]KTC86158.1 hypothetical protein Ldro_2483 [Legionella drozanskii LLAP-1]PJE17682.1 MAG: hypothetical protein CK430_01825 [Legionella sp.]
MKVIKIALTVMLLCIANLASAITTWTCTAVDTKNNVYSGSGVDLEAAEASAITACSQGLEFARNCAVQNCSEQQQPKP